MLTNKNFCIKIKKNGLFWNMPIINLKIEKKIITVVDIETVVNYNSDYTVHFDFDEEWNGLETKTARFVFGGKHEDIVFSGNECSLPLIKNSSLIGIGVFSGNIKSTNKVFIPTIKSVLDENSIPEPPTNDVYNQIIEKINNLSRKVIDEEQVKELVREETKGIQTEVNDLKSQVDINTQIIAQSGLAYKADTVDTYNERVTAEGLNIFDGQKSILKKVEGNTVAYNMDENGQNGTLKSATFGGIESTNADGTETATLAFHKTETPLGVTIDFEAKKITDYGVTAVITGEENVLFYPSYGNSAQILNCLPVEANYALGVSTDLIPAKMGASGNMFVGTSGSPKGVYMLGVLDILGFTTNWGDKANPTTEEKNQAIANFKAYLAQRYADGNPVTIRYLSSTLQSETDFTADNEHTAYKGGTEKVLENDGAEFGADNTLTQNYLFVTGVKQ